jgi:hypothetical protein
MSRDQSRAGCLRVETDLSQPDIEPHFLVHTFDSPVTTLAELSQIQQILVTSAPFLHSSGRGMLPPLWSGVAKFLLFLPNSLAQPSGPLLQAA